MNSKAHHDQEVWVRIQSNDAAAFAELYDSYWLRLYKTALHYTNDKSISEDIVQDVFVMIWDRRHHLHIEHFSHYLTAATRYEVFRYLKKTAALQLNLEAATAEKFLQPATNLGAARLHEMDQERHLNDLLQTLPNRCREIFQLSKKMQLSNEEIAIKLGISKHTVENQLAMASKQLKLLLSNSEAITVVMILNLLSQRPLL